MTTTHPSRSAPLCGKCRHLHTAFNTGAKLCNHPSAPVSLVNGLPIIRTDDMRSSVTHVALLAPDATHCGDVARLFEPLPGMTPEAPTSRIPAMFRHAAWRGTLPADPDSRRVGISFDTEDGQTVRLQLDERSALSVCETLSEAYSKVAAGTQSPGSPEILSAPSCVPSDGVKTAPADASSIAFNNAS